MTNCNVRSPRKMALLAACAAALLSSQLQTALAHDSWLVPDSTSAKAGEALRVMFITSEDFPQPQSPTKADRVEEWLVVSGDQRTPVANFTPEQKGLSATVELGDAASYVVGLALKPKSIELDRAKFEEYLASEGAEAALRKLRAQEGSEPQRELYTKFAKTFVEVGDSPSTAAPPTVGHALEIVPLSNPAMWRAGDRVRVRIIKNGRPAAGLRVSTGREGLPAHSYGETVTTDRAGEVTIALDAPGLWFLRTHTIDNTSRTAGEPDWSSLWASATFRVGIGPSLLASARPKPSATPPPAESPAPANTNDAAVPPPAMTSPPERPAAPAQHVHAAAPARPARAVAAPPRDEAAIDAMVEEVRTIHGMPGPWVVAGYRMGERALRELGLPRGSFDLEVVHECPMKVQYSCVADGVQAATGASVGKLNLKLREADASRMRTVFTRKSTGRQVVIVLSDAAKAKMTDVPYERLETEGRVVAAMPEDDLLVVVTEK